LHYGLQYLSDELAAIDLTTMRVHPFPHALCLKALPPADHPLAEKTIYTARTMHVPTECLPSHRRLKMLRLEAISFFIQGKNSQPVLNPLRKAEVTERLFTNALNPLSHPGKPGCCH
jgi:hypothetical protein